MLNLERRTPKGRRLGIPLRCSMFDVQLWVSRVPYSVLLLAFLSCAPLIFAAEVDLNQLPPSAGKQIDFARDIQPIFESSCLRCHGLEKPKSRFRLDNRASALKGGENGVDIFPGDSAKSPLIHYVAGLVEDMEMPPAGKGDPLTTEQISLLRAWIDQGADWSATKSQSQVAFSVAPTFRYFIVRGNERKFREIEGHREGSSGGIESLSVKEQIAEDTTVSAEGHALFGDEDYAVKLSLDKTETGFIRAGVAHWQKYYDDSGAFHPQPFVPSVISLDRDLHLEIGRAWVDFGLTLPDWPQMVLGYEYQWKEGAKSTLQLGDVRDRNVFPAVKGIDEKTHILKFDLVHEFYDWRIEDNARVEIYDSRTRRDNVLQSFGRVPGSTTRIDEKFQHTQGVNTLHLERQLGDWLFLAGGYFYSRLEGDASYSQQTFDPAGILVTGPFWFGDAVILKRETHLFSLSGALTGIEGLSVSAGLQSEWSNQDGFGRVRLDEGDPMVPASLVSPLFTLDSNLDKEKVSENFAMRFTKIPWTVLFGEARWGQEGIRQVEDQSGGGAHDFSRDTDAANDRQEYRVGFHASPWRPVSFTAQYKRLFSESDYDYLKDNSPGYSAFIRAREIDTDEVMAKLVVKPAQWLKTTLTYRLLATDYQTTTDSTTGAGATPGGRIFAGNSDGHVFSVNASVTPWSRLYLSTTFSYSRTRTMTADSFSPFVAPYRGDIYSVMANSIFALNKTTDLQALYSFSQANYGQSHFANGIPMGIDYARHVVGFGVLKRWRGYLTTNVRYNFYHYNEPRSGHANDYVAHGIFATLNLKWP